MRPRVRDMGVIQLSCGIVGVQVLSSLRYDTAEKLGSLVRGREPHMATDYDAPRKNDDDVAEDSIEELKSRRNDAGSANVDEDENEAAENFELPGADLSKEELTVHVVPRQEDEFTCSQCFLVHHASQLDHVEDDGSPVCTECAF